MNKNQIIETILKFPLPNGEFAVFGSAVLGIREIREVPNIDIITTDVLWNELQKSYSVDDEGFIRIGKLKFSNWWFTPTKKSIFKLIRDSEVINGIPFVQLSDVRDYKSRLNRQKDKLDIALIDEYIKNTSLNNPTNLGYQTYKKLIDIFIKKVNSQLDNEVVSIILFGSICRNQATGSSDIDMFIFYDNQIITREKLNNILINIIISLRDEPEYKELNLNGICPEIFPFVISKSRSSEILWVFLDATDHGIIVYDKKSFGKNMLVNVKKSISGIKARRFILPNGKWCWLLYEKFTKLYSSPIKLTS
jgi:predicted nucleotidyltransferase